MLRCVTKTHTEKGGLQSTYSTLQERKEEELIQLEKLTGLHPGLVALKLTRANRQALLRREKKVS